MRTNQIAGHVSSQQRLVYSKVHVIRKRDSGGKRTTTYLGKNASDVANTELTTGVNNSHNKGNSCCLQECVIELSVDWWEIIQVLG